MAQTKQPEILSAEARTKQRDQAASDLVRALLIINGGGAVALLVFLQATLFQAENFSRSTIIALTTPTIIAVVILSFGAALGAAFHLFRYQASWYRQSGEDPKWKMFQRLYLISASLSLFSFLAGIVVIAVGVWNALKLPCLVAF